MYEYDCFIIEVYDWGQIPSNELINVNIDNRFGSTIAH